MFTYILKVSSDATEEMKKWFPIFDSNLEFLLNQIINNNKTYSITDIQNIKDNKPNHPLRCTLDMLYEAMNAQPRKSEQTVMPNALMAIIYEANYKISIKKANNSTEKEILKDLIPAMQEVLAYLSQFKQTEPQQIPIINKLIDWQLRWIKLLEIDKAAEQELQKAYLKLADIYQKKEQCYKYESVTVDENKYFEALKQKLEAKKQALFLENEKKYFNALNQLREATKQRLYSTEEISRKLMEEITVLAKEFGDAARAVEHANNPDLQTQVDYFTDQSAALFTEVATKQFSPSTPVQQPIKSTPPSRLIRRPSLLNFMSSNKSSDALTSSENKPPEGKALETKTSEIKSPRNKSTSMILPRKPLILNSSPTNGSLASPRNILTPRGSDNKIDSLLALEMRDAANLETFIRTIIDCHRQANIDAGNYEGEKAQAIYLEAIARKISTLSGNELLVKYSRLYNSLTVDLLEVCNLATYAVAHNKNHELSHNEYDMKRAYAAILGLVYHTLLYIRNIIFNKLGDACAPEEPVNPQYRENIIDGVDNKETTLNPGKVREALEKYEQPLIEMIKRVALEMASGKLIDFVHPEKLEANEQGIVSPSPRHRNGTATF